MSGHADEEREPFLEKARQSLAQADDSSLSLLVPQARPSGCNHHHARPRPRPLLSPKYILFHVGLVAIYTLLSGVTVYAVLRDPGFISAAKYTSPAWLQDARLRPTPIVFHGNVSDGKSAYAGPAPDAAIDGMWESLLSCADMRAADDELVLSGTRASVKLDGDEDGNLVWLTVFRELSCLRTLRESVYRDVYQTSINEVEVKEMRREADQCIEVLRQGVMCRPDLTLTTFEVGETRKPQFDSRDRIRECIDWEALLTSLKSRRVSS